MKGDFLIHIMFLLKSQTFAINKNVSFFPTLPEQENKPEFIQNYSGLPSVYKISSSFGNIIFLKLVPLLLSYNE